MNPTTTADPYERLGIRQNAPLQEIEKAYREMVVKWHPDRHSIHYKEFAREQFKAVQEAYENLSKSAASQNVQSSSQSNQSSSQPHSRQAYSSASSAPPYHSTSKQSSKSGQSYNPPRQSAAYQPYSKHSHNFWQSFSKSFSHLNVQWKKVGRIGKIAGIGIVGSTIASSAYFGNEYILKCGLEREVRDKDSFYSETVKLMKSIKNKDYADSFGMNIHLEAMIKLGEKRKYDVSSLQKIDDRIDKELVESAKEIGLSYSRELKNKRVKIEEKRWNRGWLAKFIYQIFKGKIKSPNYNINDSEFAAGYVKALKESRIMIRGKYEGMKIRDKDAFYKLKDYFENQAKWLDSKSRIKCLNKIRGL